MRKIVFLSLAVMFSLSMLAGEKVEGSSEAKTTLEGVVFDAQNGETLAGVAITANGETHYTDFDGHFVFQNVSAGSAIKIEASYVSYNSAIVEVKAANQPIEISLNSK